MEYSQFDRRPAHVRGEDRRSGHDRRDTLRREADRPDRLREMTAFATALCGGLAVLYLFFVAVGTVDLARAAAASGAAVVLALIWLGGFWHRMRSSALVAQRPDRERRGF